MCSPCVCVCARARACVFLNCLKIFCVSIKKTSAFRSRLSQNILRDHKPSAFRSFLTVKKIFCLTTEQPPFCSGHVSSGPKLMIHGRKKAFGPGDTRPQKGIWSWWYTATEMRTFCADAKYFKMTKTMMEMRTFCANAKYVETTMLELRTFCADAKYVETTRDSTRRWTHANE